MNKLNRHLKGKLKFLIALAMVSGTSINCLEGANYAIANHLEGPYKAAPPVGNDSHPYELNIRAHGKMFNWHNQTFFTWCRFLNGTGNEFKYRESIMTYVHFKENGELVYDQKLLDRHLENGVDQYDASWDAIEAEWYMFAEGISKINNKEEEFVVQPNATEAFIAFPNMRNLNKNSTIVFSVAATATVVIEICSGENGEDLIGKCLISPTAGMDNFKDFSGDLKDTEDVQNITLKFSGYAEKNLNLNAFSFK